MKRKTFRSVMWVPVIIGLSAGGMALLHGPAAGSKALPVYGQVPAFSLVDQHSRTVSNQTLSGSTWIADFIFTRCSGQCPMMTAQLAKVGSAVPESIKLISFTVDPAWDSPSVLAQYAKDSGADARWSFVTGDLEIIRRLCREGFQLSVSDDEAPELLTHSSRLALVDREGKIRGYYEAGDEAAMRQLRQDAKTL
jgi:protein SCO1/2